MAIASSSVTSPDLYSAPQDDFNDSFVLDSQTAHLLGPTSVDTEKSDKAERVKPVLMEAEGKSTAVSSNQKYNQSNNKGIVGVGMENEAEAGFLVPRVPDAAEGKVKAGLLEVSPPLYNEDLSGFSSEDSALELYMDNFTTQREVEASASPILRQQEQGKQQNNTEHGLMNRKHPDRTSDNSNPVHDHRTLNNDTGKNPATSEVLQGNIFSDSPELLAASNYERMGYSEDGLFDSSNENLEVSMPFQDPQASPGNDKGNPGECLRVSAVAYNVEEDMRIALEALSDTFSPGPPGGAQAGLLQSRDTSTPAPDLDTITHPSKNTNADPVSLNNSLTFSMIERVLEDDDISMMEKTTIHQADTCDILPKGRFKGGINSDLPVRQVSATMGSCKNISPGVLAVLDAMSSPAGGVGGVKRKPVPRQKGRASQNKGQSRTSQARSSGRKRRSKGGSEDTSPPKRGKGAGVVALPDKKGNESVGSDCVPPTPPDEPPLSTTRGRETPNRGTGAKRTPQRFQSGHNTRARRGTGQNTPKSSRKSIETPQRKSNRVQAENSLLKWITREKCTAASQRNASQDAFTIIDVAADKRLFETFIEEWKTKTRYSISVACEPKPVQPVPNGGIGGKFRKKGKATSCMYYKVPIKAMFGKNH